MLALFFCYQHPATAELSRVEADRLPLKCGVPTGQLGTICYSAFSTGVFYSSARFFGLFEENWELAKNARGAFSPLKTQVERSEANSEKQPPSGVKHVL